MRVARWAVAVLVVAAVFSAGGHAAAWHCGPTFGYGNVGYSSGYSFTQIGCGPRFGGWGGGWCAPRSAWGGGWCGPRVGWGCRPWGWRRWCAPPVYSYGYGGYGCSYGWPAWYGTSWAPACGSVWMGAPFGGGFFSGGLVPYPTIGYPVVVPGFFSSTTASPTVAALAAARPSVPAGQRVATVRDLRAGREAAVAANVPRASNAVARLRAARLVAVGDQHLREADGDQARLRRAVDAYRRAATIAADQPDTHVRQAIALVALGERAQADAALARAAAIDGRLADVASRRGDVVADPVFGGRAVGSPPPAVARGQAILRQIAAQAETAGDAAPPIARVAARWAERFGEATAAVAVR